MLGPSAPLRWIVLRRLDTLSGTLSLTRVHSRWWALCVSTALIPALGCGGGSGTPAEPLTVTTATATGAAPPASLTVASAVPGSFSAAFRTASGKGVSGVAVTCTADNQGTVASPAATTNSDGVAQCQGWTLGTRAGPNTLTLSSGGASARYTVSGTADAPVAITLSSGPLPALRSAVALTSDVEVQVTDRFGNSAPAPGRAVIITTSGGSGVTTLQNGGATTGPTGRAVFTGLTLAGLAGARQLTITASDIATPLVLTVSLVAGLPSRLAIERDLPNTAVIGVALTPAPILILTDSVGNGTPSAGVRITAAIAGATDLLLGDAVVTDAVGRATFTNLVILGDVATRTLQFFASGASSIASQPIALSLPSATLQPAAVVTSTTTADTSQRIVVLGGIGATAQIAADIRNSGGTALTASSVRWRSRDESRATVDASGRVTGVRAGRTFVIAHSLYSQSVSDSVLVFVPANATGPLVSTALASYRITAADTFSIVISVEMRDGRALTAADIEVAWPGANAFPFAPFTVESFTALRPEVVVVRDQLQEVIRLSWTTGTPVTGTVALVRLNCRVNLRNVANQMLITANQLVTSDLADVTATASVLNPVVIIR